MFFSIKSTAMVLFWALCAATYVSAVELNSLPLDEEERATEDRFASFAKQVLSGEEIKVSVEGLKQILQNRPERFEEFFKKGRELLEKFKNDGRTEALQEERAILALGRVYITMAASRELSENSKAVEEQGRRLSEFLMDQLIRIAQDNTNIQTAQEMLEENIKKTGIETQSRTELALVLSRMQKNQRALIMQTADALGGIAIIYPELIRPLLSKMDGLRFPDHNFFMSTDAEAIKEGLDFLSQSEKELKERLSLVHEALRALTPKENRKELRQRALSHLDRFCRGMNFLARMKSLSGLGSEHPLNGLIAQSENTPLLELYQKESKSFERLELHGDFFALSRRQEKLRGHSYAGLTYDTFRDTPWLRTAIDALELKNYSAKIVRLAR